jgi:hypothetical protein
MDYSSEDEMPLDEITEVKRVLVSHYNAKNYLLWFYFILL